jgi:hypothetical protein
MKTIIITCLLVWSVNALACTAFLQSDYIDGQSRICVYDHLGSAHITAVASYSLCPQTVTVYH